MKTYEQFKQLLAAKGYQYGDDAASNAYLGYTLALGEPVAPEGWKLVPLEPTNKMTAVGQEHRYQSVWSIGAIYREMLAASPAAPAQSCGDAEQAFEAAFEKHNYPFRMNGEERNKYDFEAGWKAHSALTAEKVAAEQGVCNLDVSPWQCANCYSGIGECTAEKVAAEPVYQVRDFGAWQDVPEYVWKHHADTHKRIAYSEPQPAQTQVAQADAWVIFGNGEIVEAVIEKPDLENSGPWTAMKRLDAPQPAQTLSEAELAAIRVEAATLADDWAEREPIEPTRKEADAKFVLEILRLHAEAVAAKG
jgi:hypothetical protein